MQQGLMLALHFVLTTKYLLLINDISPLYEIVNWN